MPLLVRSITSVLALTMFAFACIATEPSGELTGVTRTVTSLPGATIPAGLRLDATFRDGTIEGSSVERWKFSGPAFQLLNETGTVEATCAPA